MPNLIACSSHLGAYYSRHWLLSFLGSRLSTSRFAWCAWPDNACVLRTGRLGGRLPPTPPNDASDEQLFLFGGWVDALRFLLVTLLFSVSLFGLALRSRARTEIAMDEQRAIASFSASATNPPGDGIFFAHPCCHTPMRPEQFFGIAVWIAML